MQGVERGAGGVGTSGSPAWPDSVVPEGGDGGPTGREGCAVEALSASPRCPGFILRAVEPRKNVGEVRMPWDTGPRGQPL